ncbi:MAG: PH domain-containing protein [Bryobacteraceae bacterium]
MSDLIVRPSRRQAHALLILCLLPIGALLRYVFVAAPETPKVVLLAGLLLLIFPLRLYIRCWSLSLRLENGLLRLRRGLFTEHVTSMALERIQEVSVDRTLWQRLWGTGDIHIESAAESAGIVIMDVDEPQEVADHILELSRSVKGRPS